MEEFEFKRVFVLETTIYVMFEELKHCRSVFYLLNIK